MPFDQDDIDLTEFPPDIDPDGIGLPDLDPNGEGLPELDDVKPDVVMAGPLDLPVVVPHGLAEDNSWDYEQF